VSVTVNITADNPESLEAQLFYFAEALRQQRVGPAPFDLKAALADTDLATLVDLVQERAKPAGFKVVVTGAMTPKGNGEAKASEPPGEATKEEEPAKPARKPRGRPGRYTKDSAAEALKSGPEGPRKEPEVATADENAKTAKEAAEELKAACVERLVEAWDDSTKKPIIKAIFAPYRSAEVKAFSDIPADQFVFIAEAMEGRI
jgi:hypothetical protein